jgi:hypothetical protein
LSRENKRKQQEEIMQAEDRFTALKKYLADCCNAELFMIAKLAIDTPDGLAHNWEYQQAVIRFKALERGLQKALELAQE